jgi:hypothetical protein
MFQGKKSNSNKDMYGLTDYAGIAKNVFALMCKESLPFSLSKML